MDKNAAYKEKFEILAPFYRKIFESVKKDLKQEHLKSDGAFCKKHFPGKIPLKLTVCELIAVYPRVICAGEEKLGEFVANRWLLKNTDIYDYFAEHLKQLNPQFDQIERIEDAWAHSICQQAIQEFGAQSTYIFAVFNSLVVSEAVYKALEQAAQSESEQEQDKEVKLNHDEGAELKWKEKFDRMLDRYEKKCAGLEKKYIHDTESLKKQIAILQRKLHKESGLTE